MLRCLYCKMSEELKRKLLSKIINFSQNGGASSRDTRWPNFKSPGELYRPNYQMTHNVLIKYQGLHNSPSKKLISDMIFYGIFSEKCK